MDPETNKLHRTIVVAITVIHVLLSVDVNAQATGDNDSCELNVTFMGNVDFVTKLDPMWIQDDYEYHSEAWVLLANLTDLNTLPKNLKLEVHHQPRLYVDPLTIQDGHMSGSETNCDVWTHNALPSGCRYRDIIGYEVSLDLDTGEQTLKIDRTPLPDPVGDMIKPTCENCREFSSLNWLNDMDQLSLPRFADAGMVDPKYIYADDLPADSFLGSRVKLDQGLLTTSAFFKDGNDYYLYKYGINTGTHFTKRAIPSLFALSLLVRDPVKIILTPVHEHKTEHQIVLNCRKGSLNIFIRQRPLDVSEFDYAAHYLFRKRVNSTIPWGPFKAVGGGPDIDAQCSPGDNRVP